MSTTTTSTKPPRLPPNPDPKPTPYTFDLGHLLAVDPNPLPQPSSTPNPADLEATLQQTARSGAQALLNQLLSTCPISTPTASTLLTTGVLLHLPEPLFPLPREKPLPPPKAETKWARFAKKKGIAPKAKQGKMFFDETAGEWVPRWGYKGNNKKGEGDWIVEVDDRKDGNGNGKGGDGKEGGSVLGQKRTERKERVRRNERAMRRNERNARRNGA